MTIHAHLGELESAGLVRLAQADPTLEYIFRHALVQEAAYGSLIKHDRRKLHRGVGEALEADGDCPAPVIAHHFLEAGELERALPYLVRAGDAAARVHANAEAALHYSRAIEIATTLPSPPALTPDPSPTPLRSGGHGPGGGGEFGSLLPLGRFAGPGMRGPGMRVLLHLFTARGQALELSARYVEALDNYDGLRRLAREKGERGWELAALMARAKLLSTSNPVQDPAEAQALLEQAGAMARELGDRAAESKVLWNLMLMDVFAGGDMHRAVERGEHSLRLARELNLREQMAFSLNDLGYAYAGLGRPARSLEVLAEARELWRELGNLPMLTDCLGNTSINQVLSGRYDEAMATAAESLQIGRSIGNLWGQTNSRFFIGHAYLERGEPDEALRAMEEAIGLGEQCGHPAAIVGTRADLGWVYASLGALERGMALARRAHEMAQDQDASFLRTWPISVLARLHVRCGDLDSAEAAIAEGRREVRPNSVQLHGPTWLGLAESEWALARGDGIRAVAAMETLIAGLESEDRRAFIPEALCLKASALAARGDAAAAREALERARAEAEAMQSRRILWPILIALADLEAQRDDPARAAALRAQARDLVAYIAGHIPTPELRASFLAQPLVRRTIDGAGVGADNR